MAKHMGAARELDSSVASEAGKLQADWAPDGVHGSYTSSSWCPVRLSCRCSVRAVAVLKVQPQAGFSWKSLGWLLFVPNLRWRSPAIAPAPPGVADNTLHLGITLRGMLQLCWAMRLRASATAIRVRTQGGDTVSRLPFVVPGLEGTCFSACRHFLADCCDDVKAVHVHDAMTGSCLVSLSSASAWVGPHAAVCWDLPTRWCGCGRLMAISKPDCDGQ